MERNRNRYPNPEFRSFEVEEQYWQKHSPLTGDYEEIIQRERQARFSYLVLPFANVELKQLRDAAQHAGISPTTLARNLILQGLETA